jgi:hypothetical protein
MKSHLKQPAALAGLLALAAPYAVAQNVADPVEPPSTDTMILFNPVGPQIGAAANIVAGEARVVGRPVTGKPYSADSITETIQVLADGNRIVSTNASRIYRDSAGRTRHEQTLARIGAAQTDQEPVTMITIDDPVEKVSYFLDPREETVRALRPLRFELGREPVDAPAGTAIVGAGAAIASAGTVIDSNDTANTAARMPNVIVQRTAPIAGAQTVPLPAPPAFTLSYPPMAASIQARVMIAGDPSASLHTEDLGEQVLEGVLARGTRHTQTIAAGEIGNERPIEISTETWYSEEIEALISRRTYDPRFGETIYTLINVTRDEPPPELFIVPHSYRALNDGEPASVFRAAPASPGERPQRSLFIVRPGAEAGND